MEMMWLGLLIGLLVSAFVFVALLYARGGNFQRAWWGLGVAGRCAQDPSLEAKVNAVLGGAAPPPASVPPPPAPAKSPPPPAAPPKPSGEPLRLLTLLQSEARLLDFLMEDFGGASDAQVGAGGKEIHKKAAAALKKYLVVEPVLAGADGERVTVGKGFDPSAVRVVGNVTGEPPYTGELQHPGWRVKEIKLPTTDEGQDPFVVQPAEVQV